MAFLIFILVFLSLMRVIVNCQLVTLAVQEGDVGKQTTYFIVFNDFDTWNNNGNTLPFNLNFDQNKSSITIEKSGTTKAVDFLYSNSQYYFEDLLEIKSSSNSIFIKNFYNPSYSGTYTIKYEVKGNSITKYYETQVKIQAVSTTNQMSLNFSDGQQTNSVGILSLNINPSIPLPQDTAVKIKIPQYSPLKPALNFINNPVVCRQKQKNVGDPDILCEVNAQNELIIRSILASKQTAIQPLQLEILNVNSPVSTKSVGGFFISIFGYSNNKLIQIENEKSVTVKVANKPKSQLIQSTSQLSNSLTSISITLQTASFFASTFAFTIKLPTEFPLSSFQSKLKGYNSEGREMSLIIQSNGVIVVQSDAVVPKDETKMFIRLEGIRNYQGVFDTTTYFEVVVYSDQSLLDKVYEDLTSTKYSTLVNQLKINSFNFTPQKIQTLSSYVINVELVDSLDDSNMSQNRYSITLPSQLKFGDLMIAAMVGKGKKICTSLTDFLEFTGQSDSALCEMERDSVIRVYAFYNKQTTIAMSLKQIMNPYSTEKSLPFLIEVEIQKGSSSEWLKVYQNDQQEQKTVVQAISGEITVSKFESTQSQTTFDLSSYNISFGLTSRLVPSSFIIITFPSDDFFFSLMDLSNCSCEFSEGLATAKTQCLFDKRNFVQISLQSDQTLLPGQKVTVLLKGIRNPRSTKPTKSINVQSMSPTKYLVDEVKQNSDQSKLTVRMLTSTSLLITSVQPASFAIGDTSIYTFTLQTPTQILNGDSLVIGLSDLVIGTQNLMCNGIQGFPANLPCSLENKYLVINIASIIAPQAVIQFTVSTIRNPYSNVVSSPLTFSLKDTDGYLISQAQFSEVAKRGNTYGFDAVKLQSMEIKSDNLLVGNISTFKIDFNLPIPVKSNQAIIINLASEIGLSDQPLDCFFLAKGISQNSRSICQYQKSSHSILITNFIPPKNLRNLSSQSEQMRSIGNQQYNNNMYLSRILADILEIPMSTSVTISLAGIRNKLTNGPFKSDDSSKMQVSICSVDNNGSNYIQLATSSFNLPPSFVCSGPCSNCFEKDTQCTSCLGSQILLPQDNTCQLDCPNLYARIDTSQKYDFPICMRCLVKERDVNCAACSSSDLNQCVQCVQKFKLISESNKPSQCVEITSDNDPLRNFVYDLEFNLPYISTYIFCFGLYIIIRKIWMVKSLQVVVVFLSTFSLIELITLFAFIIKIVLFEMFLPILICCLAIVAFLIIQVVMVRKFSKSLQTDGQFALYQPNYKVIRVIQKIAHFLNFKVFLMYRSCFSVIRDVYDIPFSNSQQHSHLMKRGLQITLLFHISLLCFDFWAMYYTYNYRNVMIPPFFFIEYGLLQFIQILLLIFLLVPNSKYSIDKLFDIVNEQNNKYKITQLDLKSKQSQILVRQHLTQDHLNPYFQAPSVFVTANQLSSHSQIQNFASRTQIPRSSNNLNTHVNIQQSQIPPNEQVSKPLAFQRNGNRSYTTSILSKNQTQPQIKICKSQILHQDLNINPNLYNGYLGNKLDSQVATPVQNNSANHDISPTNFNSSNEMHVQGSLIQQEQLSQNISQQEHNEQQQRIQKVYSHSNQIMIEGDGLIENNNNNPHHKIIKTNNNNSTSSEGLSDPEIRSRNTSNNSNVNINRNNHRSKQQEQLHQQYQSADQKHSHSDISSQNYEQLNTGNFQKQSSNDLSIYKQNILVTPERQRSPSGSPSPHSQSTSMLKTEQSSTKTPARTLFFGQNSKQNKKQSLSSSNKKIPKYQGNEKQNFQDEEKYNENTIDIQKEESINIPAINQSNLNASRKSQSNISTKDNTKRLHPITIIDQSDISQKINTLNSNINSQQTQNQQHQQQNTNLLSSHQANSVRQSSELCSKKYTESSEEVEESHCQNAQRQQTMNNNYLSNEQNIHISSSLPSHQSWNQQKKQDFQSPRDFNKNKIFKNKSDRNDDQSPQQGTPYIGNNNQNSIVDSLNGRVPNQNEASPQTYTFSKQQGRLFQEQINQQESNQNEVSPTNINRPQYFDNHNKNQPPSFSQAFNNSHGNTPNRTNNFQNNKKQASQIVSRFDQLPNEQGFSQNQDNYVNHHSKSKNSYQNQSNLNNNQKSDVLMSNPIIRQNQNQISENQKKLLNQSNSSNFYSGMNLKQSSDSKVSDYFPS